MRLLKIELSKEENAAARARYEALYAPAGSNDDAFAATLAAIGPSTLCTLLTLRDVDSPGAALIRNLPIDRDLPPTPTRGADLAGPPPVATAGLLGLTRLLGESYGYEGEYEGGLVTHVLPV